MNPINRVAVFGLCSTLLALGACESNSVVNVPHRDLTGASLDMRTYDAMAQAVVAQQSLYPYHFETDAAGLNQLGERDVVILSRHYQDASGTLNIARGDASDELYEARVESVLTAMATSGVDRERVDVQDGLPGGSGVSSDWTVKVKDRIEGFTTQTYDY